MFGSNIVQFVLSTSELKTQH